jgi:hypothetical protein
LGDDRRIAVVQGDHDEAIANARLIAAAPEMLEALKAAVEAWETTGANFVSGPKWVIEARNIIAKAEGTT